MVKSSNHQRKGIFSRPEYAFYIAEALTTAPAAVVASIYVIFLLNRGLNFKQVAIVDGFYMIVSALVDFPTGGMADKYGRGLMAAIGNFLIALGFLAYSIAQNLTDFLISEGLAAIGFAFYSGALEAWIVDSLKRCGREHDISKIFGTNGLLSYIMMAVSGLIGGIIAEFGQEKAFLTGAVIAFFGSLFIAVAIGMGRINYFEVRRRAYITYLKRGFKVAFSNSIIRRLLVVLGFVVLAIPSFNLTWAPRLKELGGRMWLLGATSSFLFITVGLAQYFGGLLTERFGFKKVSFAGLLLFPISFFLMAISPSPACFIGSALLYETGFGLRLPSIRAWFNKAVPSEERATVLSLRATLLRPLSLIGMAIMGVISDNCGLSITYFSAILISLPACLVVLTVPEVMNSKD